MKTEKWSILYFSLQVSPNYPLIHPFTELQACLSTHTITSCYSNSSLFFHFGLKKSFHKNLVIFHSDSTIYPSLQVRPDGAHLKYQQSETEAKRSLWIQDSQGYWNPVSKKQKRKPKQDSQTKNPGVNLLFPLYSPPLSQLPTSQF